MGGTLTVELLDYGDSVDYENKLEASRKKMFSLGNTLAILIIHYLMEDGKNFSLLIKKSNWIKNISLKL